MTVKDRARVSGSIRDRCRGGEFEIIVLSHEIEARLQGVPKLAPPERAQHLRLTLALIFRKPGTEIPRADFRHSDARAEVHCSQHSAERAKRYNRLNDNAARLMFALTTGPGGSTRTLLLLALVSLPLSAEEFQFNLSGLALPMGEAGSPNIPFNVTFMMDTLSGQSSSSFSGGCVTGWQFSGVQVSNLFAAVGGQSVLSVPSTVASGRGGDLFPGCVPDDGFVNMPGFSWLEIRSGRTTPLDPNDPLADLFLNLCNTITGEPATPCFVGGGGQLPGWNLGQPSVKIAVVPEPGMLGLMLLGLSGTALRRRRSQSGAIRANTSPPT